jgi:hypothetical protein
MIITRIIIAVLYSYLFSYYSELNYYGCTESHCCAAPSHLLPPPLRCRSAANIRCRSAANIMGIVVEDRALEWEGDDA